jgi:hypothetical protein
MKKQEWEQDIINRQRNIVFPDTVLNEGRFYWNIFSRDAEFTHGQRIGLIIWGLSVLVPGCVGLADSISALAQSRGGLAAFWTYPALFMLWFTVFGIILILRGAFPPQPSRLIRLRSYRRPRIR